MKPFLIGTCLAAAPFIANGLEPAGFRALTAHESSDLRALDRSGGFADLRAGQVETHVPMDADERALLAHSQLDHASLADLRAGDLSNSALVTILLVVAIVAVVLIIV
jgi:hypothetical protein